MKHFLRQKRFLNHKKYNNHISKIKKFGFCKIPLAIVKRYSSELKQDIETISKCLETERLGQLEKQGKLGVSCKIIFLCFNFLFLFNIFI